MTLKEMQADAVAKWRFNARACRERWEGWRRYEAIGESGQNGVKYSWSDCKFCMYFSHRSTSYLSGPYGNQSTFAYDTHPFDCHKCPIGISRKSEGCKNTPYLRFCAFFEAALDLGPDWELCADLAGDAAEQFADMIEEIVI